MSDFLYSIIDNLKSQVTSNQFLSGGLILGILTGMLVYLRNIPSYIWGRIVRSFTFRVTIDQSDPMYGYLQNWLNKHYSHQLKNVKASFQKEITSNILAYDSPVIEDLSTGKKYTFVTENKIVYNHYGDTFIVFYAGRYIKIKSEKEKIEKAQNISQLFFESFFIEGIAAETAIKKLLQSALDMNLEQEKNRVYPKIKINIHSTWRNDSSMRFRDLESIFIPKHQKQMIVNDIQNFINDKDFYLRRNIPYRRGYLLFGPPGTGKSSLVSALSNHFKKDLHVMNLTGFTNDNSFEDCLHDVNSGFLLIEDIDRYNFSGKERVNFSTFINAISGVRAKDDLIIFITTNNKSKLDDALIRSGRIDMKIEIGLPSIREVNEYLSWFYDKPIEVVEFHGNMADVENICVQNKHDSQSAVNEIMKTLTKSNGHTKILTQ